MERKKAYYWCTCLQMITPIKVRRLIEEAGGPSEVFGQSDEKLVQMGFTAREQRIYHEACAMEKTIEAEYEKLSQSGIRFVTIEDEEYPVLLKEVADRPIGLFVKGNLPMKTGDAANVIPFFGMTVLAAGAVIVIAFKKKRRA